MAGVTRMWEARAAPGRVGELVGWLGRALVGAAAEIYRGVGDNRDVVVVLFHPPGPGAGPPAATLPAEGGPATAAPAAPAAPAGAAPAGAGGAARHGPASVVANVPPELLARPAQAWDFERVSSPGPDISDRWGDR
ncbi:hypothetical protein [Frankia sp. CiP1_Cm_nod2]|uniref:hypothetical protein n=2 Tax=unclassified Frankia TaxID=2632575 RepID=UPI004043BF6C